MSSAGGQFLLLLGKNFTLQKRHKCVTVFEIVIPLFFALLLLGIRAIVDSEKVTEVTSWDSFQPDNATYIPTGKKQILYTPSNSHTDALMATVKTATGMTTVTGYPTISDLIHAYNLNSANDVWGAVTFEGDFSSGLPAQLSYSLRLSHTDEWRTERTFPLFTTTAYRSPDKEGGDPSYAYTGFLTLHYNLNKAIIETHTPTANLGADVSVVMAKMAYPAHVDDSLITVLQANLPFIIFLSFILNALQISKNIAYEKEKKLKETMKLMGLSTFIYWLSWFVKCLIYMLVIIIIYTVIFSIKLGDKGKILNYSEPTVFLFFLFMYIVATIAFCFMVSTFFNSANTAAFACGMLFFLTYVPTFFLNDSYGDMSRGEKMATCLLSNMGMVFGVNVLMIYEGTGEGAQWTNFHKVATVDDNFSLLDAILMLLVDTILYMLVAWYVDNVNPGSAGVPQKLWFPFMPSYWCGSRSGTDHTRAEVEAGVSTYFERDPTGHGVGVSIRHLNKCFKSKEVVKDTNMNIYEGQITVLLGHNGAGKTTTISMLTGFLEPTSGTAIVNNYDVRTELASMRRSLGVCPQHNILFDLLTVEEHLRFFARLKGCPSSKTKAEVDEMIKVVGLENKRTALSSTLSGGQKRKLSVGIALIAGSKTIMLDEPTSGMDPAARRQMWEILQRHREGRTIILTTHFMDEADVVGDRIAIMAEGVVKCCGTSMFLKKLYGAGYHMVLVKEKGCDVNRLTRTVQAHIPSAALESEVSAEVSYLLPFHETAGFPPLFTEIEVKMSELGISSFGVSATTMEEVFLKVSEGASSDDAEGANSASNPGAGDNAGYTNAAFLGDNHTHMRASSGKVKLKSLDDNSPTFSEPPNDEFGTKAKVLPQITPTRGGHSQIPMEHLANVNYISYNEGVRKNVGFTRTVQQMAAVFIKKFIHTKRNMMVTVAQLILPVLFTIMALASEKARPDVLDEPSLSLNLHPFSSPVTSYSDGTTSNTDASRMAANYSSLVNDPTKVDRATYTTMDNYFATTAVKTGLSTYNERYIVAADFQHDGSSTITATAHFNGQPFHGVAISQHLVMNAMLKFFSGSDYDISAANYPLPKKLNDAENEVYRQGAGSGFTVAISILFGMAFMTASFVIFLVKERSVGSKHLQVVSGAGPAVYWLATFLWDIINYLIPVICVIVVFAAFQTPAFTGERLGVVFLVFLLYGWAILPHVYLLHFLFTVPASGMVAVSMLNILAGIGVLVAVFVLQIPGLGTEDVGNGLEWAFIVLFPNFNLGYALMEIYTNYNSKSTCESVDYKKLCARPNFQFTCCFPDNCGGSCLYFYDNYLHWESPGIGRQVTFLLIQGLVFFAMLFVIELGLLQRLVNLAGKCCTSKQVAANLVDDVEVNVNDDDDVVEEKARIEGTPVETLTQTESIILKNVNKVYGRTYAVQDLCVGIPTQECFGLLGQNGAGKTTTFKMLTGDVQLSSGHAYLSSFSVKSHIKQVQQNLGYCPQFDALIDQMTGRETLYMYARLRGITEAQIKNVVNELIDIMMLRQHADKQTIQYSGGNKRKLSTAIALIGDPPFIFLDEPTTGMDPGARRQLWNVLSQVRASGRTLVLTSHSMEECDALCTRIVIMVNGQFVCLGSPQHLKNKYGHGYTLFCRMRLDDMGFAAGNKALQQFIQNTYPHSKVFDDNQGYVHFQIPDDSAKLADIFGKMEEAKSAYNVEDYSVHQTTLEQIFLTFTRTQKAPVETMNRFKISSACNAMCCSK